MPRLFKIENAGSGAAFSKYNEGNEAYDDAVVYEKSIVSKRGFQGDYMGTNSLELYICLPGAPVEIFSQSWEDLNIAGEDCTDKLHAMALLKKIWADETGTAAVKIIDVDNYVVKDEDNGKTLVWPFSLSPEVLEEQAPPGINFPDGLVQPFSCTIISSSSDYQPTILNHNSDGGESTVSICNRQALTKMAGQWATIAVIMLDDQTAVLAGDLVTA